MDTVIVSWGCTDASIINSNIMKYHEILKYYKNLKGKKINVRNNKD